MSCVAKIKHDVPHCTADKGLQVFYDDAKGTYTGYCFSCAARGEEAYVKDPYKGYNPDTLPKGKTKAEVEAEVAEIRALGPPMKSHRGIPAEVFRKAGVRLALSEYDGKTPFSLNFPMSENGKLLGFKTIMMSKKAMWSTGCTKGADLFNWESAKKAGSTRLYITEGECFTPEAKVLVEGKGWVSLGDYEAGRVMQAHPDGSASFVEPLAVVDKNFEGDMVEYKSGSYYSLTTPNHQLVRVRPTGELFKTDNATHRKDLPVPRTVNYNGSSEELSDLDLRLWVMLSADFTFRESGDLYANFSKSRKVERFKYLADRKGLRYSCNTTSEGKYSVFIHRGHGLNFAKKLFGQEILESKNLSSFLDELVYWDGNTVPNRNQVEYSSKLLPNAELVQTAAHLLGYTSTIMPRSNDIGSWYKVSILWDKQTSSTKNGYKKVPYSGRVMCLTVPSGMLLVKQGQSVSVSGNCDALALKHMLDKSPQPQKKEGGNKYQYAVCSVPTGASGAAQVIGRMAKEINSLFKEVVLVFDNDEAGNNAVKEVQKVLPSVMEAPHVTGIKDANEALQKGQEVTFVDFVKWKARKPLREGVVTCSQAMERGLEAPEVGKSLPWPKTSKVLYGKRGGEATCIAGGVGCGKTVCAHEGAAWSISEHNTPVFAALLEEKNIKTCWNIASKIDSIQYNRPEVFEANKEQYYETMSALEDKLFLWNSDGGSSYRFDLPEILSAIRFNYLEYGCLDFYVDNMTRLVDQMPSSEANEYINKYSSEIANLASELNVHITVFSHLNPPKGKDAVSHEEGGEVYPSQLTGSRGIMRSFPNIIGFERNKYAEVEENKNNSFLSIIKNRDYGDEQKIKTQYNPATGRLLEFDWEGDALY